MEIFLLIIETVTSRMGIDGLGEHLGGEGVGEDGKWRFFIYRRILSGRKSYRAHILKGGLKLGANSTGRLLLV